jgi:hypothetical protein
LHTVPWKILVVRNIEGVAAHGVRLKMSSGALVSGDSSSGVSITDRLCSDDLSAVVLTVYESTNTGAKTTIAMQKIERTEPDPALFQIPPNYTVTESIEEPHEQQNPRARLSEQP